MPSRSEAPWGDARAGATLLEMLVVLTALGLVAGVVAAGLRGPSPMLRARAEAAELARTVATARLDAVRGGRTVTLDLPAPACGGGGAEGPARVTLHPDGTARGMALCLPAGAAVLRLAVDPLTGRLGEVPE